MNHVDTPIRQWRKTLIAGLPEVFSDQRRRQEEDTEAEKARLFEEIGRLKVELDWLKEKRRSSLGAEELRTLVQVDDPALSIQRQCELLGLARSSYYYRPQGVSAEDLECMRLIDELFTQHPFYGSRRLRRELAERGQPIGRHHVRRLMRQMGLDAYFGARWPLVSDQTGHPFRSKVATRFGLMPATY